MTITDEQLKAWKTLADEATDDEWIVMPCFTDGGAGLWDVHAPKAEGMVGMYHEKYDAEFIAASRTAVPALIAEVERLQSELINVVGDRSHLEQELKRSQDEVTRLEALKNNLAMTVVGLKMENKDQRELIADYEKISQRRDKWRAKAEHFEFEAKACHQIMADVRTEAERIIPGAIHGLTIDAARKMRIEVERLQTELDQERNLTRILLSDKDELEAEVAALHRYAKVDEWRAAIKNVDDLFKRLGEQLDQITGVGEMIDIEANE